MILLTLYVAIVSAPPVGDALFQTFLPSTIDFATITTIVGGTVGGYITYSGAHRLLDKGTVGIENLGAVNRAALTGIAVTGLMRYVLFLAILGVVASGVVIDVSGKGANPAAQAFQAAAGETGYRIFGAVLWFAAITSVIGAAYTSVSFITVFKKDISERARNIATVIFIAVSLFFYVIITTPPAQMLDLRWRPERPHPADRPVDLHLCSLGTVRPDGRLPLSALAAAARRSGCAALTWYMGYKSIGPIFALLSPAA
jgi:Mn2+/Fe2+ NRAMP family transporter